MAQPIKLLITDDHKLIITGIISMLEGEQGFEVVAEANHGDEALEKLEQHPEIDVVLMDIKMKPKNGIDTTRELLARFPDKKVMALTMFDEEEYITNMLQAGALGYVLKNTGKHELINAIRQVHSGQHYFSHEATSAVMKRFIPDRQGSAPADASDPLVQPSSPKPLPQLDLTNREVEILKLIANEMTNHEIADKLFISPRTVHSHRRNLMQKIGVKNTAGLVRYALQAGLLE